MNLIQILGSAVSVSLLVLVLELVRRRKLTEEYSLFWILSACALLLLSLWREVLHVTARWLGVVYPPMVLLLLLVLVVFVGLLYFSVVISRLRRQVEQLVEELALFEARRRSPEEAMTQAPQGDEDSKPRAG